LSNGVLVSSSQQANTVLYGDGLNHFGNNYGITSYKFEIAPQSITFTSASLVDLLSQPQYSQSISLGRIVKISIPTSVIEPAVEQIKTSADAQKLVVSGSNGIVESLTLFNYITGSTAVVFASASKNDMGSVVNNNLTFVVGTQRLNATTLNRDLGTYIENGILVSSSNQAFEAKYPNNDNRTNKGYTYLSSATIQKTYSTNSYAVLNPTSADLHTRGQINYWITGSTIIPKGVATFTTSSLGLGPANTTAKVSIPVSNFTSLFNSSINVYNVYILFVLS
jgi:hypothetical protein